MPPVPPEVLEPFRRAPQRAAVLVDFDGTLAPIVERADEAVPLPGAGETLERLAASYAVAGIISGRPVAYLAQHVPASVDLFGQYGLEARRAGVTEQHPAAARWQAVVDQVAAAAAGAALPALEVEHKGLSLTLHFRTHPQDAGAVLAWAAAQAEVTGLELREAKMSVELHPPVPLDKGTTLEDLAAGLDAACFIGDDVGDLPAFDALDRLAERGVRTLRVAVTTSESIAEMVERADVVVDGPAGALALLQALIP